MFELKNLIIYDFVRLFDNNYNIIRDSSVWMFEKRGVRKGLNLISECEDDVK